MTQKSTLLVIRAQARGGKFLADDIGGASITVRDVRSGQLLASGVTRGSSGELVETAKLTPEQLAAASKSVVVTPSLSKGTPGTVYWLVPDDQTSQFLAELSIDQPTLLEISAFGARGGLQSAHRVTTTTWLAPEEASPSDPGFVIEIPGLLVQVLKPTIHTALPSLPATVPLEVNVAMMCGCPINDGEPWIPEDFDVTAHIQRVGGKRTRTVQLQFDTAAKIAGRFSGHHEVRKAGYYEATFIARQKSTGNTGSGMVTFFYQAS